jgi:general secretion pathway protein K
MNFHPAKKNDGIALIVVMIAIALLSGLAISFAFAMKIETRLARNSDNEQQMLWLGRAGVETARWVLAEEAKVSGPYDALNQIWAGGPGALAETNSALAGFSMKDIPVGGGSFSLKIVDLERRVNINTATPMQLQQILTTMGVNADSINVVADSIEDWISPENAPRTAGAESDYYQGLIPPYYAKNAPMDDLSELVLIKGVTSEMYDGTPSAGSENNAPALHHKLGFAGSGDGADYPFHLKDVFTPISSGKININTADANVLQTLPGVDAQVAADIIKQRAGPDGIDGTEDDTPFLNPGQLTAVDPQLNAQVTQLCDVHSRTFEVHVTAQIGTYQREYVAILWRNTPTDIEVLGFWWK